MFNSQRSVLIGVYIVDWCLYSWLGILNRQGSVRYRGCAMMHWLPRVVHFFATTRQSGNASTRQERLVQTDYSNGHTHLHVYNWGHSLNKSMYIWNGAWICRNSFGLAFETIMGFGKTKRKRTKYEVVWLAPFHMHIYTYRYISTVGFLIINKRGQLLENRAMMLVTWGRSTQTSTWAVFPSAYIVRALHLAASTFSCLSDHDQALYVICLWFEVTRSNGRLVLRQFSKFGHHKNFGSSLKRIPEDDCCAMTNDWWICCNSSYLSTDAWCEHDLNIG